MSKANKKTRLPVVVILGHVDHGKTSILDYIRESRVAEGESGGITQHTGAYQIEQKGQGITFIDTPGHEAFGAMRSRGANVADIAILVVAADDGVMPQTKEAISLIQKAKMPYIVAINKIDKTNGDAQKAINSLLENNVMLEGYGGDVPHVAVSAKTGDGIDNLLDMINLVAELEELSADPNGNLEAVTIEAELDARRGPVATLLVKNGTLRTGAVIAGSTAWAKVRSMQDFRGQTIDTAGPATPAVVLGLNNTPRVGEIFVEAASAKEAQERLTRKERKQKEAEVIEAKEDQKIINIVVKADVDGTLEAVHDILRSIENETVRLRVLKEDVGEISDADVRLASSGSGIVVGFRVAPNNIAKRLAEQEGVVITTFETIYNLVEGVRAAITAQLEPQIEEHVLGAIKVLKIFRTESSRMILGGRVTDGEVQRGASAHILRGGEKAGRGKLKQIKKVDKVIESAKKGEEIGILFEGNVKVEQGDILEIFEKRSVKPSIISDNEAQ